MMTSKQIADALKPFVNFAPAIHAAAEIVASAEWAQESLKSFDKRKAELEKQIAELEARFGSAQAQVSKEKIDFNTFMANQEAQRQTAREQTQKVADALSAMQLKLLNINAEYEAKRKEKDDEIAALDLIQSKIKAEIERLKKQFAA